MSKARKQYAIVVIGLTIGIAALAVIVARPRAAHWLEVRSALARLSHTEAAEREDALQWLLSDGEDPDAALLKMLESPSDNLRRFAADKLRTRPAKPEITATFLRLLQDDSYLQRFEIENSGALPTRRRSRARPTCGIGYSRSTGGSPSMIRG